MESSNQPLRGFKIVTFVGDSYSYATMIVTSQLLAQGASVDLVVPPSKEHPDSSELSVRAAAAMLTEGATVHRLELKYSKKDFLRASELLRGADVVVEGFRPGSGAGWLQRLQRQQKSNALIWLSLPGFAPADADYRDVRAFEAVISSVSGAFTDMGLNRQLMAMPVSYSPLPLASVYAVSSLRSSPLGKLRRASLLTNIPTYPSLLHNVH